MKESSYLHIFLNSLTFFFLTVCQQWLRQRLPDERVEGRVPARGHAGLLVDALVGGVEDAVAAVVDVVSSQTPETWTTDLVERDLSKTRDFVSLFWDGTVVFIS